MNNSLTFIEVCILTAYKVDENGYCPQRFDCRIFDLPKSYELSAYVLSPPMSVVWHSHVRFCIQMFKSWCL